MTIIFFSFNAFANSYSFKVLFYNLSMIIISIVTFFSLRPVLQVMAYFNQLLFNKIKMTHEKHRLALKLKRSEQDFGIRLMQWYGQAPASAFVYDVVLESAAYRAGLIIGDRIINVNGTNVTCAEQIHLLINGQSEAHIQIVRPTPDKIEKLYKTPSFSNPQCSLADSDSETTTDENIVVKGTLLERFPESHWILKMLGRASYLDQIGVGR